MKISVKEEAEIEMYYQGFLDCWSLHWRCDGKPKTGRELESCLKFRKVYPTVEDLKAFAYDMFVFGRKRHERLLDEAEKRWHKKNEGFDKCIMVTFNLLKSTTIEEYREIWESLKYWDNNLIVGSKMRCEFFGRSLQWNPHIHIWVPMPKGRTVGKVRQACIRKFKSQFNINVQPGNKNTLLYVNGLKQDDKAIAMAKDAEFRITNHFEEVYQL